MFWRYDTGAVWPDQFGLVLPDEGMFYLDHVLLRDALRDTDNEGNLGLNRLQDGGSRARRRDVDDRGVGVYLGLGLDKV